VAGATLTAAAAFEPLRRRVQQARRRGKLTASAGTITLLNIRELHQPECYWSWWDRRWSSWVLRPD
jgi:hypothetical protein